MAFWPFNRKKKQAEKLQEKESSKSATRANSRNNPAKGSAASASGHKDPKLRKTKPPPRPPRTPPDSKPPVPEKSALRPQVPPAPLETTSTLENPFDEKTAAIEQYQLQAEAGPSTRAPLAELYNPEAAPPPALFQHANTDSQTSLQPEHNFSVTPINAEIPTLRAKRNDKTTDAARRKSSKRKSGTKDREQEIKAMTSPIPIPKRPQTFSSSPLARDTKRVPGGLNRYFERPTSEVSLPIPESVRSSMSGESGWHQNYMVRTMDALSPRPTIRYSESPRNSLGSKEHRTSRQSVRRDKAPAIPEEPFDVKARMEDLADDLDAKALRELMERDRRRRERKKKSDQEKLQRKLQRKADRQKAGADAQAGPSRQKDVDVKMEDAGGLGISPGQQAEAAESSAAAAEREATQSPSSWLQDPSQDQLPSASADPFKDLTEESHLHLGPDSEQASMKDEPIIETAKAVRLSSASMSPPLSPVQRKPLEPSSLSNFVSASPSEDIPEAPSLPEPQYLQAPEVRRDSESSGRQEGSSWTSFFRRRATKAQRKSASKDRQTPSEFSNTSRESFARSKQPPPAPVVQRSFRRGSTPQRTQSKFREDLPELPLSPPRSRVQSPEAQLPSPYIDAQSKVENLNEEARVATPIEDIHPAFREQVSINQSLRTPSPEGPASGMLSQSLASIDSEGSWLSGRQPKRSSIPISSVRASQASVSQDLNEENENAFEDSSFARREVNTGTVRGPGALSAQLRHLRTSSGGRSDSPELLEDEPGDGSIKYDTVKGSKPNIVQRAYAKSREGLIGDFANAEEDSPISPTSPDSPISPEKEPTFIHRATSVDYGKKGHVRQLSAGSARLLDIPARTSAEVKRSSVGSDKVRSPLSETFAEEAEEGDEATTRPQNE